MSLDAQQLLQLLPAIYRLRDAEQGGPLEAFLSVVATQIAALEENLAQLYDDQFIETCAEWVVPYIGDLVAYRQLSGATAQVRSPRAEVANTIGFRRRKGTTSVIQQLASEITGWDAQVVEFFQTIAVTQYLNHLRPSSLGSPDLRAWQSLDLLGSAFDSLSHTVNVRGIASGGGRHNIANVGIFLWRLPGYALDHSPPFKVDDLRYLFSPLGNNMPLFNQPGSVASADPTAVPGPIGRRDLSDNLATYYGSGKSLSIDGVVDPTEIVVCDLSDNINPSSTSWAHTPPAGMIAIDPELGRIAFATAPASPPAVSFHYAFSGDFGGGQYDRSSTINLQLQPVVQVPSSQPTIQAALALVSKGGAVEVVGSGRYAEALTIQAQSVGASLELRAANQSRPTVELTGDLQISGDNQSEITLSGLLITGGTLRVVATSDQQTLQRLRLVHCTLVPGLSLATDGTPKQPATPSLIVETANTIVEIDHCIVGGLQIVEGASVQITDSIVDATQPTGAAYAALDNVSAGASLQIQNSTVIGKVHTLIMNLASNTIFLASLAQGDAWVAPILADRRQTGCLRFCYVPPTGRVPRRYQCQPATGTAPNAVSPSFTSLRYGDSGYCQLSQRCPPEITQGADDGSEMGVFHDLFQEQRASNLRQRLDEYLRFGLEAGLFYAS